MWDDLPNGFYSTDEFQQYAELIARIIKERDGVSIADIHRAIEAKGDAVIRKWTLAAIDTLEDIEPYQSGSLTRYVYRQVRKAHALHSSTVILSKEKNLTPYGAYIRHTGY